MSEPSLSADERHLLDSLALYGRIVSARNDKPSLALVGKGLAEDTTPERSTMLLVLTEAGMEAQASGSGSPGGTPSQDM